MAADEGPRADTTLEAACRLAYPNMSRIQSFSIPCKFSLEKGINSTLIEVQMLT